jgi:hypothetical protein
VRSVLDNTLAAATLLQRSAPLALQEIELEFLVALALGDLGEFVERNHGAGLAGSLAVVKGSAGAASRAGGRR